MKRIAFSLQFDETVRKPGSIRSLTGCTLSAIHCRTGSLLAVIVIHAGVDAIYSFSPFLRAPWSPPFTDFFDALALLLALSLYPNRTAAAGSKMPQLVRVADDI